MATTEQQKYIQFVNLLNNKNFFSNISFSVISPLLNCICIITKPKEAFLYLLPNNETIIEPFWQCPSKVQRCLFSEDGKNLFVILNVNSIHIYTISDKNVCLLIQIKALELTKLLQTCNIDYSAVSEVEPLGVQNHEIIVLLHKKLIVSIEWSFLRPPAIKYSLYFESPKDIFVNNKFIYVLHNNGILNVYNIGNGRKCMNELNTAGIVAGHSFFKVSVQYNCNILALVNQDEEILLVDASELFNDEKCPSGIGSGTKLKDKWMWPYRSRKASADRKASFKILGKVSPPSGLVVSYLQFSLKGLFAFYSILGQSKCNSFKVVEELSGTVIYNFDGLVESMVVSGGPLPIVMTDSILSICLGVLCNDYFIIKLCEIVPNFGFSKELEKSLLSEPWKGACDFHLVFLKIILNLHLNVFQSSLRVLAAKKNESLLKEVNFCEKKITERFGDLFKVVLEYQEPDSDQESPGIKEKMLIDSFLHAVRLLDLIQVETKAISDTTLFSQMLKKILVLFESVKMADPLKDEWITWMDMTDPEIIQEAIVVGAVALAHVFLVTNRNWDVEEVEKKFKIEARSWIVELIMMNDLENANIALGNLGCEPRQHLKELCLSTDDHLLRDILVNYLLEIDQLSEEEKEATSFGKNLESALSSVIKRNHVFEEKISFSASEKVSVIQCKLPPYNGSIDLLTLLESSKKWRDLVLTEVYFNTGDIVLEKYLEKQLCWQYLLEANQIDLLERWIEITCDPDKLHSRLKSSDYLNKSFFNLFVGWPVSSELLDFVFHANAMTATKAHVLDKAASYGLFSDTEKGSFKKIVARLENNSCLSKARMILSGPKSNVSVAEFDNFVFCKAVEHSLKPVVLICLEDFSLLRDSRECESVATWIDVWNTFGSWDGNRGSRTLLKEAVKKSLSISECSDDELALVKLTLALMEKKEISEVIKKEGKLLELPLIAVHWQTAQGRDNRKPDVALYDLLRCSKVPAENLFLWQTQNRYPIPVEDQEDAFPEFPHFNHQVLCGKFGFRQNLDPIYYLKQGRPIFAFHIFVVESLRIQGRLTTKRIKRVCGVVHGLALRFWKNPSIGSSCVAFITMLGEIAAANVLRMHLAVIGHLSEFLPAEDRHYIGTLVRGIVEKDSVHIQEMASILENLIMLSFREETTVGRLEAWYLAVSFCNTHNLPLPSSLLKRLAQNRDWFSFVMCLDVFKYPYDQAIELIEEIDSKILKSHLIRALTRTTLKLSTTSPSKTPPKILLEPESNGKDDSDASLLKDNKDAFQSFVTNIYTEVLNTIQTFTDKNLVLPWSCEQNPDSDVLLTLLKCESEPDTSKSLLVSSIELQSPVLAVLATCFQSDNVFPNLLAWLVSSIPTSLTRLKRREEGQQFVDRMYGPKEIESLLVNFFSAGYFQTFYRGMKLFMSENPMTLFLKSVYHGIALLDFATSLELLKEFIVEITHFRVNETSGSFSRDLILNVVAQCAANLLSRSDLQNYTKRQFLRVLAESDLSSVDPIFPNYLLWSQICEILESSDTNLDFIQLYDITMVSEELQNCLDDLASNFQFVQALEICSLLSLNKDKFIVSMWKHQLDLAVKTDGSILQICRESSLAFKDENVNPNLAASFYQNMALQFESDSSSESLRNRYHAFEHCLHWRRLMENTLTSSFREESDAIELEKWKCCVKPNFDLSLLKLSEPVGASYSLLLSLWSASKVLVRSQALEEPEMERVEHLINLFLDQGDLHRALRLSAFFKITNQDLIGITSCLKMTHGELTPSELSKLVNATTSAPKKLWFQRQNANDLDLSEYEMVPLKEQNQTLTVLQKFCETVKHGKSLAKKILICYRLAVNLDTTFKDIASERNYLSLFPKSVSLEGINRFSIASDLITLADLSPFELAKFLKDKIVSAVMEFHSTDLVLPVTLWDVSLDSDFHLIINLMSNPLLLGNELLQVSVTLPCSAAVEVLIRAHDCFTACCNVEGIGKVLRRARILASLILQEQQWQYLVRLLVGIERYTDMNYIFQMLKDNGQFEQLLRKGMHKVPGLHVAISEFLQRHCSQDWELSKMVAAHFGLHSKLATFWQQEADEIISKLPVSEKILKDTSKTRQALNLAMDNYSHAVQLFLQARKLNRALKVAHQAQMVALQISLLGGPFVLKLESRAEFQALVNESLSVSQIMLISRASEKEPDWVVALHERWVIKGDKAFYSDLKSSSILSHQLLQNHANRYNLELMANGKAKDRMRQLLQNSSQFQSPLYKDLKKI